MGLADKITIYHAPPGFEPPTRLTVSETLQLQNITSRKLKAQYSRTRRLVRYVAQSQLPCLQRSGQAPTLPKPQTCISHKNQHIIACLHNTKSPRIGIDIEANRNLPARLLQRISNPSDIDQITKAFPDMPDSLHFSYKESLVKSLQGSPNIFEVARTSKILNINTKLQHFVVDTSVGLYQVQFFPLNSPYLITVAMPIQQDLAISCRNSVVRTLTVTSDDLNTDNSLPL